VGINRSYTGNQSWHRLYTNTSNSRIGMQFDYRNQNMQLYRRIAQNMYWVLIGLILVQFLLLIWRGVGLQPVWVLIEYLQLVSFMPIYNFRFIPYLYDAFKPALVSHMIIFDETPIYNDLDDDYFNKNYKNYWLSVGRLGQAFFFYLVFLAMIVIANIVCFIFFKINVGTVRSKAWVKRRMVQFKFNAYIRYYMIVYFDTTFFSVMKIFEGNN
jgi:small-conductance mechanosensitive channel